MRASSRNMQVDDPPECYLVHIHSTGCWSQREIAQRKNKKQRDNSHRSTSTGNLSRTSVTELLRCYSTAKAPGSKPHSPATKIWSTSAVHIPANQRGCFRGQQRGWQAKPTYSSKHPTVTQHGLQQSPFLRNGPRGFCWRLP